MKGLYKIVVFSIIVVMLFNVIGLENTQAAENNWKFAFFTPSWFAKTIFEAGMFYLHYLWSDNLEANKHVMENSEAIYQDLSQIYNEKGLKLLQALHDRQ